MVQLRPCSTQPDLAARLDIIAETGSTNADLLARLAGGEAIAEGYWLCAKVQNGGKGRDGRLWISPVGNLYASTIINLRPDDPTVPTLALVMGLAVHRFIREGLMVSDRRKVQLKWPNDVLVGDAKIAGILLQRSGNDVVAGFGINLASAPSVPGRNTTCLAELNYKYEAEPEYALGFLAQDVADEVELWRKHGVAPLLKRWQAAAHQPGTRLSVHDGSGGRIAGTYTGLAQDGALCLRLDDGSDRVIHAGDVMLEAG